MGLKKTEIIGEDWLPKTHGWESMISVLYKGNNWVP